MVNALKDKTHRDVERACFRKVKRYDTRLAYPIFKKNWWLKKQQSAFDAEVKSFKYKKQEQLNVKYKLIEIQNF